MKSNQCAGGRPYYPTKVHVAPCTSLTPSLTHPINPYHTLHLPLPHPNTLCYPLYPPTPSEAFYNLLCHDDTRLSLLTADLWWAFMRITKGILPSHIYPLSYVPHPSADGGGPLVGLHAHHKR